MAMKKFFMKFENKGVPGLKKKLVELGWSYFKVEDGATIMYKWITDSSHYKTVSRQKHKFNETVIKYLAKKSQEKFENQNLNRQNKLDKKTCLINRGYY